jgi:hypothetical protein
VGELELEPLVLYPPAEVTLPCVVKLRVWTLDTLDAASSLVRQRMDAMRGPMLLRNTAAAAAVVEDAVAMVSGHMDMVQGLLTVMSKLDIVVRFIDAAAAVSLTFFDNIMNRFRGISDSSVRCISLERSILSLQGISWIRGDKPSMKLWTDS